MCEYYIDFSSYIEEINKLCKEIERYAKLWNVPIFMWRDAVAGLCEKNIKRRLDSIWYYMDKLIKAPFDILRSPCCDKIFKDRLKNYDAIKFWEYYRRFYPAFYNSRSYCNRWQFDSILDQMKIIEFCDEDIRK